MRSDGAKTGLLHSGAWGGQEERGFREGECPASLGDRREGVDPVRAVDPVSSITAGGRERKGKTVSFTRDRRAGAGPRPLRRARGTERNRVSYAGPAGRNKARARVSHGQTGRSKTASLTVAEEIRTTASRGRAGEGRLWGSGQGSQCLPSGPPLPFPSVQLSRAPAARGRGWREAVASLSSQRSRGGRKGSAVRSRAEQRGGAPALASGRRVEQPRQPLR